MDLDKLEIYDTLVDKNGVEYSFISYFYELRDKKAVITDSELKYKVVSLRYLNTLRLKK